LATSGDRKLAIDNHAQCTFTRISRRGEEENR
jgi:hypothetical protein